jgi:hypothetical protein
MVYLQDTLRVRELSACLPRANQLMDASSWALVRAALRNWLSSERT